MDNNIVATVLGEVTGELSASEVRPEQVEAAVAVEKSLSSNVPLLLEAGTGTGKTLAYLVPAVLSGKKIVISTATKQLSEQIVNKDIPFLQSVLASSSSPVKSFSYALLKGRDNYFCWYKDAENSRLSGEDGAFFDSGVKNNVASEIEGLKSWADETKSGDRSEAPADVSDKIWKQYSSNSVECVGKQNCPFGAECFAEMAKDKARNADIVVTNHALVARELISESPSWGERDVIIFDELHEVDRYMTDAWSQTASPNMLKDAARVLKPVEDMVGLPKDEFAVSLTLNKDAEILTKALEHVEPGRIPTPSGNLASLLSEVRVRSFEAVTKVAEKLNDKNIAESFKQNLIKVRKPLEAIIDAVDLITDGDRKIVKWVSKITIKDNTTYALQAAPLYAGDRLQQVLNEKGILMIGASATVRVAGSFNIPKTNLGFKNNIQVDTVAITSPFEYKKQAMLYIPDDSFPSPVGKDRFDHSEAVKAVSYQLVKAVNGRAVVLTTTTKNIREIGEYLKSKKLANKIILQGDAPNGQIIEQFKNDETSILVGTMGLWHGLDLPGQTASLLIIDKIPFKPSSDPLSEARKEHVESEGGNAFNEVFVAEASIMLTQGFGRLIRTKSDKGIVAILDNRILTKNYGNILLKTLPPAGLFTDRNKVVAAAERLGKMLDEK